MLSIFLIWLLFNARRLWRERYLQASLDTETQEASYLDIDMLLTDPFGILLQAYERALS